MKICVLTQTASDISDYYKEFFKGVDFYFLTFKNKNPNAIDFMPSSSWSAGRNRLWEEVRGKYDYYVFIDDDLTFHKAKIGFSPILQYILETKILKDTDKAYSNCSSATFLSKIRNYLTTYKPEIATVRNLNNQANKQLDYFPQKHNSFVRRVGWFDAQFTIFSNYAAERLLPYDTKISGWASAQILIYLLAHEVFASKAIGIVDLAVNNSFHSGAYVPDYKSNMDCKNMIDEICKVTNNRYPHLYNKDLNHVSLFYGEAKILNTKTFPSHSDTENYAQNYSERLSGIESLMTDNTLQF